MLTKVNICSSSVINQFNFLKLNFNINQNLILIILEIFFRTLIIAAFAGAILKIIAYRLRIPAIITLLIGGIVLGPEVANVIDPTTLDEGLKFIVSICIGIILFEGGLSLEIQGYKKAPNLIRKLLSLGVLITWLLTALAARFLLGYSYGFSLLLGSMIIVTGPTVISPLLQRIHVEKKLKHILNWEAVLIDPIGVFIALLCFEWLTIEGSNLNQLIGFSIRLITGTGIGLTGGLLLYYLFKKRVIPVAHNITFTLSFIFLLYFLSNFISYESGLLAVVVAGITFGIKKPHGFSNIKHFKVELSELALAILFIILSANLNISYFLNLGSKEILLIAFVIFVIRPVNIFICAYKSTLNFREKLFLSWIAPRGIVAASIASLFALELRKLGNENAAFLEIFVYSIIILTVIIQGFTADPLSKILGLKIDEENGWLIVGAHRLSRRIAKIIEVNTGQKCFLIDTNYKSVNNARKQNLYAVHNDALILEDVSTEILSSVKNLLVLTDNEELNVMICEKWLLYIKKDRMFRWTEKEYGKKQVGIPIWEFLEKPSRISVDLKKSDLELEVQTDENDNKRIMLYNNILCVINKNFISFPKSTQSQS